MSKNLELLTKFDQIPDGKDCWGVMDVEACCYLEQGCNPKSLRENKIPESWDNWFCALNRCKLRHCISNRSRNSTDIIKSCGIKV